MTFPEKLFIGGTDTDIGKTVVSSILTAGLSAGYWKPVQAGTEPQTDTEFVQSVTGFPDSFFYPESYLLSSPMSPHAAAEKDGIAIRMDQIRIPAFTQKHLIIEGAGGLLVPLNEDQFVIDLIPHLSVPVLLVGKSGLGTLNHTLLSLETLRKRNISVFGVVLVGERHPSNEKAIKRYGAVEKLFSVRKVPSFSAETLRREFMNAFGEM